MTLERTDLPSTRLTIKDLQIPHDDVANLKRFFGISTEDERRMQALSEFVKSVDTKIIDQFYQHIMTEPETKKFFTDPQKLERVKPKQIAYLREMVGGSYDAAYLESRLASGAAHCRENLSPKWYIAGASYLFTSLAGELKESMGTGEAAFDSLGSLSRFYFLDMAIGMESFQIEQERRMVRSSQQVEQAEGALRLMLDAASNVAIYGVTATGVIRSFNRGAENLLGYKEEEVKGLNFRQFYADPKNIDNQLKNVAAVGAVEHDGWMVRSDGSKFFARISTAAMVDERKEIKGYVEIVQDVTSSMEASRRLEEQRKEIANLISILSAVSSQVAQVASQLSSATANSVAAIAQTTATSDEVRQTAEQTNIKAKSVSEDAKAVLLVSKQGRDATDSTIKGMVHIREQMESIAECMSQLTNQSRLIGDIIASVDDLAQQSNLLAVNASIEAAKAGEQGKGFAVVAQEVKNLSQQSKTATAHVRSILNDVVQATTAATQATEQGTRAVEQGQQQAVGASDVIKTLAESIDKAAQATELIEISSQQQLVGMKQLVTAMESIKELSENNLESAKQLDAASKQLSDLGNKLLELTTEEKS